jgi:hypothetical protein
VSILDKMDLVLATIAYRRDWLPNIIPADNMCKKKTSNEARPKAARFNQPINLVKIVAEDEATGTKGYRRACAHNFAVLVIL